MTNRLKIEYRGIDALRPSDSNARTHSKKQIKQIAESITRFGFTNAILITGDGGIVAGHGRVTAAAQLGMKTVPAVVLDDLTDDEIRAYMLADNKLALNAGWNSSILAIEMQGLLDIGFDLELTGFSLAEIDFTLDGASNAEPEGAELGAEDTVIPLVDEAVSRSGDLWQMGQHCLICGDARDPADFEAVTFDEPVDLIFTDPPYNCKINGNVCGLGKIKHREFAMASGEMSDEGFTGFLTQTLGLAAARCKDGAIAYVCMDWRGMGPLLAAGKTAFTEQKQLCVWNKTNGGMGAFYRSKHELVFVYKIGTAAHTNSFGLGETGRYRTNVWDYAGISSPTSTRAEDLARHPTSKPVAMVADAIRDCTRRGELVLDPFGGSGTTLIAAEICGRSARLIEYDPLYCDAIIRRFETLTGQQAILMGSCESFEDVAAARAQSPAREAS
ncbi:MAG: site-specific DNA-methyltransferase [Sphingomonas sp.]|nr:site-specific DNA-methyltransferase [Sphingomonas sp.]